MKIINLIIIVVCAIELVACRWLLRTIYYFKIYLKQFERLEMMVKNKKITTNEVTNLWTTFMNPMDSKKFRAEIDALERTLQ